MLLVFPNSLSANCQDLSCIKYDNQEGFLGRHLESLLKHGLPFIKNVIKPLTNCVLIPLGLTAAASPTDSAIQKKTFW